MIALAADPPERTFIRFLDTFAGSYPANRSTSQARSFRMREGFTTQLPQMQGFELTLSFDKTADQEISQRGPRGQLILPRGISVNGG
jgi:hypothetical protein